MDINKLLKIDVDKAIEQISKAVMAALAYKYYPLDKIEISINMIDEIISNPSYLIDFEINFKSAEDNNFLFYLSNILYNLKTKKNLKLTPDIIKWLGSVWKNFLNRNISYQKLLPEIQEYRIKFKSYYANYGTFINQLENVNLVKEEFIDNTDPENGPLVKLEAFYQSTTEILSWMKPTYFFLLDYYYERTIETGEELSDAIKLENEGLNKFGQQDYNYSDISFVICQALGILEAAYLILKKKKTSKRIIIFDGKQKFLSTPEIYTLYLNKFNEMKKEISKMK